MNYCANVARPWPALRTGSCQAFVSRRGMLRGHACCVLDMQWRQRRVIPGPPALGWAVKAWNTRLLAWLSGLIILTA